MRSRKKNRKGVFEHFLGQTHSRHGEKRSQERKKLKKNVVARVHADQVPILKNLKGTVHIICV
jgi:hypothetical protein